MCWLYQRMHLISRPVGLPCLGQMISVAIVSLVFLSPVQSQGQELQCGANYTVRPGDTLSSIAQEAYDDSTKWSVLFYGNQERLGHEPSQIRPGDNLRVPCLIPTGAAPLPPPDTDGDIKLLTAGDYAPFTDKALPGHGLITELITASFENNRQAPSYGVSWINDWSSHLDPLLLQRSFDMGFPWLQPDCTDPSSLDEDSRFRCDNFLFSDPMFEMLVLLFVRQDSDMTFANDLDMEGRTLCRPDGYYTFDLNADGRRWLAEGTISLEQPRTVADCFEMLVDGSVDAVAINEFTGRQSVVEEGLVDQVKTLPRAVSIQSLHTLVPKTHPRATVLLYHFNLGLRLLRDTDEYDEILDRHLAAFWNQVGS